MTAPQEGGAWNLTGTNSKHSREKRGEGEEEEEEEEEEEQQLGRWKRPPGGGSAPEMGPLGTFPVVHMQVCAE